MLVERLPGTAIIPVWGLDAKYLCSSLMHMESASDLEPPQARTT